MTERLTDEEQARVNAKRREAILAIRRRTAILNGLAPARAHLLEGESRERWSPTFSSGFGSSRRASRTGSISRSSREYRTWSSPTAST